jgi:Spy/CpxP family protein refolding chaperone
MKRSILAVLAAAPFARADGDKKGDDRDHKPNPEWAAKMQARMKERLNLSDEQAAKLEAAMKTAREDMKPLSERSRAAEKKLEAVVGAGTDAEVEAALKEADSARKSLEEQRHKFEATLATILKPRQLAKMRLERRRMLTGRKHGGWHHKGGCGEESRDGGHKGGRWGGHDGEEGPLDRNGPEGAETEGE